MKRVVLISLAVAGLCMSVPARARAQSQCDAVAGNLVRQCGFEYSIDGSQWTPSVTPSPFFGFDGARPHSGGGAWAFADLDGNGIGHTEEYDDANESGYLSQTFATIPGASYTLTFWLLDAGGFAPGSVAPNYLYDQFAALWNGDNVLLLRDYHPYTNRFEQLTVNDLVATSTSTTLTLGGFQNMSAFVLDDVVVAQDAVTATPEPATALLVFPGLAMIAMLRRRARKAS